MSELHEEEEDRVSSEDDAESIDINGNNIILLLQFANEIFKYVILLLSSFIHPHRCGYQSCYVYSFFYSSVAIYKIVIT